MLFASPHSPPGYRSRVRPACSASGSVSRPDRHPRAVVRAVDQGVDRSQALAGVDCQHTGDCGWRWGPGRQRGRRRRSSRYGVGGSAVGVAGGKVATGAKVVDAGVVSTGDPPQAANSARRWPIVGTDYQLTTIDVITVFQGQGLEIPSLKLRSARRHCGAECTPQTRRKSYTRHLNVTPNTPNLHFQAATCTR